MAFLYACSRLDACTRTVFSQAVHRRAEFPRSSSLHSSRSIYEATHHPNGLLAPLGERDDGRGRAAVTGLAGTTPGFSCKGRPQRLPPVGRRRGTPCGPCQLQPVVRRRLHSYHNNSTGCPVSMLASHRLSASSSALKRLPTATVAVGSRGWRSLANFKSPAVGALL